MPIPKDTLSYIYAKYQANPLTFDTQNTCLKRPWFGEIRSALLSPCPVIT